MCHHSASADYQQLLAGDVAARCQSQAKQVLIAKPMKSQSKPLTPVDQAFLFHAQCERIFSQCGATITHLHLPRNGGEGFAWIDYDRRHKKFGVKTSRRRSCPQRSM
jgi:hypothetical protein